MAEPPLAEAFPPLAFDWLFDSDSEFEFDTTLLSISKIGIEFIIMLLFGCCSGSSLSEACSSTGFGLDRTSGSGSDSDSGEDEE